MFACFERQAEKKRRPTERRLHPLMGGSDPPEGRTRVVLCLHCFLPIKSSSCLIRIVTGGAEHQVSLYADDLLLYDTDLVGFADNILHTLTVFGSFSGYKLKPSKSECFQVNKTAIRISSKALPFQ